MRTKQSKYQTKVKLKKGDEVMVVAGGRAVGKTAVITRMDRKNERVYLGDLIVGKRHTKPQSENNPGGIITVPLPIHISNVMLVDPKTRKPTRVGYKVVDGVKVRFAKKSGTILSSADKK